MGSLRLPAGGMVYADTQILIYTVEKHPRYFPLLRDMWQAAADGNIEVASSELAILEALVLPLRNSDSALVNDYEWLFQHGLVRLLPISNGVLHDAARLRASLPALRTPDSLHAATAQRHASVSFVSNDRGFRRIPGLPLVLLDEL